MYDLCPTDSCPPKRKEQEESYQLWSGVVLPGEVLLHLIDLGPGPRGHHYYDVYDARVPCTANKNTRLLSVFCDFSGKFNFCSSTVSADKVSQ
jgi:hypothetical protein